MTPGDGDMHTHQGFTPKTLWAAYCSGRYICSGTARELEKDLAIEGLATKLSRGSMQDCFCGGFRIVRLIPAAPITQNRKARAHRDSALLDKDIAHLIKSRTVAEVSAELDISPARVRASLARTRANERSSKSKVIEQAPSGRGVHPTLGAKDGL